MSVFSVADRRKKGMVVRRAGDQLLFSVFQILSSFKFQRAGGRVSFQLSFLVVLGIEPKISHALGNPRQGLCH